MAEQILKRCCTCKQSKVAADFPGLKKRCKVCNNRANAEYRARNPEKSAASSRNWAIRNKDKIEAKRKRWVERNPERQAELARKWRRENKERAYQTDRRYVEQPHVRLHRSIRERLRRLMLKDSRSTFEILGYSRDDLVRHLERQFVEGMHWGNYGEWHVDHITPLSSFTISSIDDPALMVAWGLPNLRPIWAKENIRKRAKLLYLL